MDQLRSQFSQATLQADIDLKKREFKKVLSDIENLQKSKDEVFSQYDAQIKLKKQENEALITEGKRLQGLVSMYTKAAKDLKEEVEANVLQEKTRKDRAKEDVEKIYLDAQQAENQAKIVQEKLIAFKQELDDRQVVLNTEAELIEKQKQSIIKDKISLREKQEKVTKELYAIELTLAEKHRMLDTIIRQISQKQMNLSNIIRETVAVKSNIEKLNQDVDSRMQEIIMREKIVAGKERGLDEKDKDLHKQKIKLDDRAKTLNRAYKEILSRGGVVNG